MTPPRDAPGLHLTEAQVDDLVDGQLDAGERARAEAHLAACDACTRTLRDTHAVLEWSHLARASVTAPSGLWPLVAATTIHVGAVRRHTLRRMRGLLLLGALALVALTATVTWKLAYRAIGNASVRTPAAGSAGSAGPARTFPRPPAPPRPRTPPRP